MCNDCEQSGAGNCGPCPNKLDDAAKIERQINERIGEDRQTFIGALYAKAETSHLKRIEALVILQATLAEMLVPAIEGLKLEEAQIEPGSIARANAALFVEMAEELRTEALKVVDHYMANCRLVVVPR